MFVTQLKNHTEICQAGRRQLYTIQYFINQGNDTGHFRGKWWNCANSSERKWIIQAGREHDGEECPIYASMDPQAGPLLVLHGRNYLTHCRLNKQGSSPESKIHGANVGPTWGRQAPGGPHVGHMTLAIWVRINRIQLLTYAIISRMNRKYIWL